jgi:hypothetical protein
MFWARRNSWRRLEPALKPTGGLIMPIMRTVGAGLAALGLTSRVEQPVRMAAHFDLSRFRNPPAQLTALATIAIPEEEEMPDPKTRSDQPAAS